MLVPFPKTHILAEVLTGSEDHESGFGSVIQEEVLRRQERVWPLYTNVVILESGEI